MLWDDRIKRRFKLRDLDILMNVIQEGSMGKAAARLNMAQPAVSKAVADLEHMLGVRLLERSRQGVEPTVYGDAFLKRGLAMFDELRQGFQDLDFLADPTAGELRLGSTEPVGAAIVTPLVGRLCEQFPRMTFRVITGDRASLYRELAARNIELAVSRNTIGLAAGYCAETLFYDSLAVVAGADHPLARRRRLVLADLRDEPWVLAGPDNTFGLLIAKALHAGGLTTPRLTVMSSSQHMCNELVATGRFLTVVPGFSIRLPRRHPVFRALPVELPDARHPVAVITLKNRSPSPLAKLFVEHLRAFTKPLAKS